MRATHDNRIVGEPASEQAGPDGQNTWYFNNGIVALLMSDLTLAYGAHARRQQARAAAST